MYSFRDYGYVQMCFYSPPGWFGGQPWAVQHIRSYWMVPPIGWDGP